MSLLIRKGRWKGTGSSRKILSNRSMLTNDAKCHVLVKRSIVMGKNVLCKGAELIRGKLNRNIHGETNDQVYYMERGVVRIGSMRAMRTEDIKRLEVARDGRGWIELARWKLPKNEVILTTFDYIALQRLTKGEG